MPRLGLVWVLVEGRPRPVSDFATLAPARRPRVTCPACGRRLTLKLGRVRRHHAAHAPDAICAATKPETALHLDMKLALAAHLAAIAGPDAELRVRLRCAGSRGAPCDAVRDVTWLEGWDDVAVEAHIAAPGAVRRPDVLLRQQGRPVGAIEVLVSNRVSVEKADALARLGVPWVEVQADARVADGAGATGSLLPLAVGRIGPAMAPDGWRCDLHARRETLLRAARVVDVYRDAGFRDRRIYRIDEARMEGTTRSLSLRRDGREVGAAPYDGTPESRREAWAALQAAFAADLDADTGSGAFHDSPMRWATGDNADNVVEEGLMDVTPGDPLPLATRYPRRWFFARESGRWFLPPDMRDVRWDRPEHDAFGAHPAWGHSRLVVRERPVPADAWKGVVFARRPVATAFGPAARVAQHGPVAIVELEPDDGGAVRSLVVVTSPASEDHVRRVARALSANGIEHLWLSHPMDWSAARADLAWAAAGRDSRDRPVVLVDGLGIYRADAFARAFARGERRLAPETVRSRMAERVRALVGR